MSARDLVYVIAIGESGQPLGYLMTRRSIRQLKDSAHAMMHMLRLKAYFGGVQPNLTVGTAVRMSRGELRNQIPFFEESAEVCLDKGGVVAVAVKGWKFDCTLLPALPRGFEQRLPPATAVLRGRY